MFIENKYKFWHDNIIANGKNRILSSYKEKHHILPRCLGGNNSKDNLVELTAREHFMVHMLLCKFTTGQAKRKMYYAFNAMCSFKNAERYNKVNSRLVDKIRSNFKFTEEHKQKISKANKGKTISKEHIEKLRQASIGNKNCLGKKASLETRLKMSALRKGRKLTEEHKRKIGLTSIGRKQSKESILKRTSKTIGMKRTQEFKDRMSEIASKRVFSETTRKKISLSLLGNKYSLGRKHINKDGKSKMVNANEVDKYLNQGYKLGMDRSYITLAYRKHKSEMATKNLSEVLS